nr:reverse transcriptase domain-containing protein [Tanacetum cinerariifolium]
MTGGESSGSNVDSINGLDGGNPLHMNLNDSTSTSLIPFKLTGPENYRIWASAIVMQPPLAKFRTYMLREPINKVGLIRIKTEAIQITTTKIGNKETIMEMLRGITKKETNPSKELAMVKTRLHLIKHRIIKPRVTKLRNTITNPKEDLKGITTRSGISYKGPTIPTTSPPPKVMECETEVTKDTVPPTNNESTKDVQPPVVQVETQVPNFEPVVALVIKPVEAPSLLTNKEKLFELARTSLNEHCSAVLLKKLPEKLGDPGKFLIPCDFLGMDECLALADLGASINLMPLSVWNKLSLTELSPTCMTLELADRLISRPVGVTEDVFVKTGRALIDVYEGELTLRVGNKAVTFNLDQTSRYSANYDAESINQIDVINVACEEYSQEVLGFSMSGNPTPSTEPIVSTSSPTLTPFANKGDILLLEEFLNDDPSSPPLPRQELKVVEPKNEKSSIDEPPVVELKDVPPHLEYAFLEGNDKLPVIIAKDLKDEEKTALIKVLKSHKQALAWQFFDIRGINPEFYTYKILMEDDFKPTVQHQRRVNQKIHEVIKKEVLKLFNARLIYHISDSPWVRPVHCVPKRGGFTFVENKENELIPTRLVTGWR